MTKRTWVKRVAAVVGTWAAAVGGGLFLQLSPRPLALAATILAASALLWLVTDLGGATETGRWHIAETVRHVTRGTDARVGILQRSLADPDDHRGYTRNVHPSLVAVVDDRLRAHHGINRAAEPAKARAVMGDDLADFLRQPSPGAPAREPHHLSELLSRIEAL